LCQRGIGGVNQPLTLQRVRIRFGKQGALRFIGHLDLSKTWERILRRAEVPLEYTQGFNPRPRMQFAAALPVGVTSESEYLDAWLTARYEVFDEWIERLNATSPAGIRAYEMFDVPIKQAALPTLVTSADYVVETPLETSELTHRAQNLLAASELLRTRNDKSYDLRPLILDLAAESDGRLVASLVTGDKGTGRPDELVAALGLDMADTHGHRRRLVLSE
jgi:radical SAM-linked protein